MDPETSTASFQVLRERNKLRRGHKQAVRQANIHRHMQSQDTASTPDHTPTGVHKLPRELTDMIWHHAGNWPTKDTADGGAAANVGKEVEVRRTESREEDSSITDAKGEISAIYALKPPALAQVCYESRQFSLGQFGLHENTSKAKQKLANNKRRWEREYEIPVLTQVLSATHPVHSISNISPLLVINMLYPPHIRSQPQPWGRPVAPAREVLGIPAHLAEDRDLSLPLNTLLQNGKYRQLVLDLNDLSPENFWAPYMDGDPLGTYAHAMLDLLLSAQDGQILVAHPLHVSYRPTTAIYVEKSKTKAVTDWKNRRARYVHIDDTAVWRDLRRAFGDNDTHLMGIPGRKDPFVKTRDMVRKITNGGQEAREKLKDEALKPLQELWERLRREQATPLKPLPKMEVVVKVGVVVRPLNAWGDHERFLRSRG